MKKISTLVVVMAAIVFLGAGCKQSQPKEPAVTGVVPGGVAESGIANTPSPSDAPSSAVNKIDINNSSFDPATITVNANDSVMWTNIDDSADHTIVVDKGDGPVSGVIGQGKTYVHVFKKPGTFSYHCGIHPSMKGTVIVNP